MSTLYPPGLLDASQLNTLHSVEDALASLDQFLYAQNVPHILKYVLKNESRTTLALVISRIAVDHLMDWWDTRSTDISGYQDSVHAQILLSLSAFAEFQLSPFAEIASKNIIGHSHIIGQNLGPAFRDLDRLIKAPAPEDQDYVHVDLEEAKLPQRERKRVAREFSAVITVESIDWKHVEAMAIIPPHNHDDAVRVINEANEEVRSMYKFLVEYLHRPEIVQLVKTQIVNIQTAPVELPIPRQEAAPETMIVEAESSPTHIAPAMKGALHFDTPEGFGPWEIVLSKDAEKALRFNRKKEQNTFDIIHKKLKDLSNGHFSGDNQKKLKSHLEVATPIFEAKMTRDLRLVYQIDLIPSDDEEREQQAIKVYGIYTHQQMDQRMWHTISSQLHKKGKEYRERCGVRKKGDFVDADMFVPESFPPIPEDDRSVEEEVSPDLLQEEDTAENHSRLIVEKYVTLSAPLLNSIMAELDITMPHLVSTREKQIIEYPNSCYVIGRSGTGKTTTMLFKMLLVERSHHLSGQAFARPRQIFVTKSHVLAGKVMQYFKTLERSLISASQTIAQMEHSSAGQTTEVMDGLDIGLVDAEDDNRTDLPTKYSELEDRHFPLFLTYDKLCQLLEGDMVEGKATQRNMISFEHFVSHFWGSFPQSTKKLLDAPLVYNEIIGIIKGSEEATKEPQGYLSKKLYEQATVRRGLLSERSSEVYQLFKTYNSKKNSQNSYDVADRTQEILKYLENQDVPGGKRMDYIYVDEVQDNLLIDTKVLRTLCVNPQGLFWAGDTAQTISAGSAFTFAGLKAFQYRLEQHHREQNQINTAYIEPKEFQLSVNYRSHAGIVNCASSLVELITEFWPSAIDKLAPEIGLVEGRKPCWFEDPEGQVKSLILVDAGAIDFGADQCILVRTEAAKEALTKVNENVIVFTIYESKGLEFTDILLYDFFKDSNVSDAAWRVILNAITDWSAVGGKEAAPAFDKIKHASICNELKALYVAITRARANIWIADHSLAGLPLQKYWLSRSLIQKLARGQDPIQNASKSTPEEWAARARQYFQEEHYSQARTAFRNAGQFKQANVAEAYALRAAARLIPVTMKDERRAALVSAGNALLSCAKAEDEGSASYNQYLTRSADLFMEANEVDKATEVLRLMKDFNKLGAYFRDLQLYDEAIGVVKAARANIEPKLRSSIIKRARLAYFFKDELTKAVKIFPDVGSAVDYLDARGLNKERADLLLDTGEPLLAAEILIGEGQWERAVDILFKEQTNVSNVSRGLQVLIEELWRHCTYQRSFGFVDSVQARDLLQRAHNINRSGLSKVDFRKLEMFAAIKQGRMVTLENMAHDFIKDGDFPAALLCLEHTVHVKPMKEEPLDRIVTQLESYLRYLRVAARVTNHPDPANDIATTRLFGVERLSENRVLMRRNTFLQTNKHADRHVDLQIFEKHFRSRLSEKFEKIAENIFDDIESAPAFSPCLGYVLRACKRPGCEDSHSSDYSDVNVRYNLVVRLGIQFMLLAQLIRDITGRAELPRMTIVLRRLYLTLQPVHYALGTITNLDISQIPEASTEWYDKEVKEVKGFTVLRRWVRELARDLDDKSDPCFLSDILRVSILAGLFDRQRVKNAKYITQAHCWDVLRNEGVYNTPGGTSIVSELVSMVDGGVNGGILALTHIMKARIPISIEVVCEYVESLCMSHIFYARKGDNVHHTVLPRSWILKFMLFERGNLSSPRESPIELMAGVSEIMEHTLGGYRAPFIKVGLEGDLQAIPAGTRHGIVQRMMRAISYVAYNNPDSKVHDQLRATLYNMKLPGRSISWLYKNLVDNAQGHWDTVAAAIETCLQDDPKDCMVHLLERAQVADNYLPIPGVKTLVYETPDEIAPLLQTGAHGGTVGQANFNSVQLEPTPREIEAVAKISNAYRRVLNDRRRPSAGLQGLRHRTFVSYLAIAPKGNRAYRHLVLGPVVHIYVCLEVARMDAKRQRDTAREAMEDFDKDSADIEKLDDMLVDVNKFYRPIMAAWNKLKPSAPVHERCNRGELAAIVKEARAAFYAFPFKLSANVDIDLELGFGVFPA